MHFSDSTQKWSTFALTVVIKFFTALKSYKWHMDYYIVHLMVHLACFKMEQ